MEKIWLKSYEAGIAHEIDMERFDSIVDVFEQSVQRYADKPSFENMGKALTYREIGELATQFASYLQNVLQLPRGSRIAMMMPNVLQYPIAVFGALKAGMVVVNTNPLYTPRELEHQLNDSGAETIVVLENFANTLELVLAKTKIKHVIVANIGEMFGMFKGSIMNFVLRKVKKMVPSYHLSGSIAFKQALAQGATKPLQNVHLTRDDLAFLQYTGGTTGIAKGAMLTHGNICANMLQGGEWIKNRLIFGAEVVVTALPLYHIFALTVNMLLFVYAGARLLLITNPRDLDGFIKTLRTSNVTVFIGVNTLFNGLINKPEFSKLNFSTWKLSLGGGMATQQVVAQKWQRITGTAIVEAYGLTEASPGVVVNPLTIKEASGGIGLPLPSTDVQLRDEQGQEVAIGEVGELWVRGPQVMRGYWNRPDETAKVIDQDGWLATGDIAVINEQGWLRIVDRKKDLIVVSGFNVYPNEIEDVVAHHPKVNEVACIGVKSEKTGEALKLFVVRKDESLTQDELIDYCRTQLTGYKIPRKIEFCDELPKSNVGKILRRELRDKAQAK